MTKNLRGTNVNNANKDANDYLNSGNNYYNQQKYELAIQEYSKAIRLNPNFAEAYNNRALAYSALGGNKYNAESDFNRAKFLSENFQNYQAESKKVLRRMSEGFSLTAEKFFAKLYLRRRFYGRN